jgi:hypothetical protein
MVVVVGQKGLQLLGEVVEEVEGVVRVVQNEILRVHEEWSET